MEDFEKSKVSPVNVVAALGIASNVILWLILLYFSLPIRSGLYLKKLELIKIAIPTIILGIFLTLLFTLPSKGEKRINFTTAGIFITGLVYGLIAYFLIASLPLLVTFAAIGTIAALIFWFLSTNQLAKSRLKTLNSQSTLLKNISSQDLALLNQTLIDNVGEGIIITGKSGQILLLNRWAQTILSWKPRDVVGKSLTEIALLERQKGYFESLELILSQGTHPSVKRTNVTIHTVDHDQAKFTTPAKIIPIVEDGEISGALIILPDITQERAVTKMRTEFLSVVAHQLRSPLGSIRWGIEMLLNGDYGKISNSVKDMLERIYTSNQWMIALVNDLLEVSRIDQGRIPNEPQLVNHLSIIKEAIKEQELEAKQKSVSIVLNVDKSYYRKIEIDPARFRNVIQNLFNNAVKYNRQEGRVTINVSQTELLLRITVADTGIGIPKKDRDLIFSRFFRGKNATENQKEGSGLGLFVVKSYVADWNGSIWFESQEGKGTTFFLELPTKPIEKILSTIVNKKTRLKN